MTNREFKINLYVILKITLIITFLYLLSACGYKVEEEKIEPYQIKFNIAVFYVRGLKESIDNPVVNELGTKLVTQKTVGAYGDRLFESGKRDIKQVRKDMIFIVKKKYIAIPVGLQKVFTGSGYDLLILIDEDDIESAVLGIYMDEATRIKE